MPKKKDEIGHGKPPKDTQFKPGQSGNPKGRPPKKPVTAAGILFDVFLEEMVVQKSGIEHKMPRLAVLANQIIADALTGDKKAIEQVLKLLPHLENRSSTEGSPEVFAHFDKDRETELLTEFARLANIDPETMFVGDFAAGEAKGSDARSA